MAVISSYSTLVTEVASWLARSDLTVAIPGFIQNFEEAFYRDPKNYGKWMESSLNVSISTTATIPGDFLALKSAYLSGQASGPLIPVSLEQMLSMYPRSYGAGRPKWIAVDGANFIFGPPPSSAYTLVGTYYAKPALLRSFASDAAAHWLVVNAPDLLLFGSLMEAQGYVMNDKRFPFWFERYSRALEAYQKLMRTQNISGGALQTLVV